VTATVIVVPVVVLAVLFVVQFALAFHARQVLSGATQDGAAAAARRDASVAEGEALSLRLIDSSAASLLSSRAVTSSSDRQTVTITATGKVVSVLPFMGTITVRATSTAKLESFDAQGAAP
jgi:Flp pilus assembly protein TadG